MMSRYDFDKLTDRWNIDSLKWDVGEKELPMWVADMDFEVCPEIVETMKKRLSHPTFGYNIIPDAWYDSYIHWWDRRHSFHIEKDWLLFSTGVVPSISSIVRRLTMPAEKIVLQTPVYNIFFNSVRNNGRNVLENPLSYREGDYFIDFEDLEKKLRDPQTTLMILCNPHNPVGKIWDKSTLKQIGDLCQKYHVTVLSDEIHCDITEPNREYVPFASVSDACRDNSVTCIAPTKAFNIAGLQTSAIMIPNPTLRHKIWRGINNDEIAEPNSFAVLSAVAAFETGADWLDEMRVYVSANRKIVSAFLKEELPSLHLVSGEATYLLWIDCSRICEDSVALTRYIREKTGLYLSDGAEYGESGKQFVRMNIACPRERLADGLNRLRDGINQWVRKRK